jgi:hypothetical protein
MKLAPDVPPQYASPFTPLAKEKLTQALISCCQWYEKNYDAGPEAFKMFVQTQMKKSADEVRDAIKRSERK